MRRLHSQHKMMRGRPVDDEAAQSPEPRLLLFSPMTMRLDARRPPRRSSLSMKRILGQTLLAMGHHHLEDLA